MSKNTQNTRKKEGRKKKPELSVLNPNAAGIDLGSLEHWVAVPTDRAEHTVRKFKCFTPDLEAMADWLTECKVNTVAMESTGVYWIPVFQMLERRGFSVVLANAKHVKNVPGRKTDVLDCQWLQRLHSFGLLAGSFRPEDAMCIIRSYWRHRQSLVEYRAAHIQHMQKALSQMNLQLHKVVNDIAGVTGMAIIRAIIGGARDPQKLAALKNFRIRSSEAEIAAALTGDYREEHIFVLAQAIELYDFYQGQIAKCDRQIEAALAKFETKAQIQPAAQRKKRYKNEPDFDIRVHLHAISGVDFTEIDGINITTLTTIITEVVLDPSKFDSAKHFASWLGLCPNNRITGGKVKSSHTQKIINRAATAFRMAAQGLARAHCALGAYYRRMRARLGSPGAVTATAHKLARIFYTMWRTGCAYKDLGVDYYEAKYRERILQGMKKRAKQMGMEASFIPLQ